VTTPTPAPVAPTPDAPTPAAPTPAAPGAALALRSIVKSFAGVEVLHGVDLDVAPGEVVALVGENGAGKSTLIKILTGFHPADSGTVSLGGVPVRIETAADAERLGIRVVHQDRHQAGRLTVAEQLYLGRSEGRRGWVSPRVLRRRAESDLRASVGLEISADLLVDDLTVAERQLLQIARAVLSEPRVLVLDEPTAPLAAHDVARLVETVARLRARGVPIVYISHYLQEVHDIADRVVVLRNGSVVGEVDLRTDPAEGGATGPEADGDRARARLDRVVELMVGRRVDEYGGRRHDVAPVGAEPSLVVEGLTVAGHLDGVDLAVRPGEIVGVTGLVGSGVEVLAEAVTGLRSRGGAVRVGTRSIRTPAAFVRAGGAHVPSDRRRDGVVLRHTVRENIALASPRTTSRLGLWVHRGRERALAREQVARVDVRPADPEAVAGRLSGGNQQKVVLARWLAAGSRVFVLDQPTAGVDVGSRQAVYDRVEEQLGAGAAVLLVTVDLDELVGLADRIVVLYRGRVRAVIDHADATVDRVLAVASGAAA
jgi:ribose transport system ATP-binding protein